MKKGQLFIITKGDYSDYCFTGHFKVERDFSLKAEKENYRTTLPMVEVYQHGEMVEDPSSRSGRRWVNFPNPRPTGKMRKEYETVDGFQTYLIKNGFVTELEVVDYHYDYPGEVD